RIGGRSPVSRLLSGTERFSRAPVGAQPGRRLLRRVHAPAGGVDRAPPVEARSRGAPDGPGSGRGSPAAPAGTRLRLLPSGPDLVRGPTSRGTPPINAPADGACRAARPSGGNSAPL